MAADVLFVSSPFLSLGGLISSPTYDVTRRQLTTDTHRDDNNDPILGRAPDPSLAPQHHA